MFLQPFKPIGQPTQKAISLLYLCFFVFCIIVMSILSFYSFYMDRVFKLIVNT